jgi:hypothetical protein
MKRFAFIASLFGFGAAAQVSQKSTGKNSPNIAESGKVATIGVSGVSESGPKNNICPVCGREAPKWKAEPEKKTVFMGHENCGPLTVTAYGEAFMRDCHKQQERMIRCSGCSVAFFQYSE